MDQYRREEDKLINHPKIQSIASKFWAVLPKDEAGRLTKQEYINVSSYFPNPV